MESKEQKEVNFNGKTYISKPASAIFYGKFASCQECCATKDNDLCDGLCAFCGESIIFEEKNDYVAF